MGLIFRLTSFKNRKIRLEQSRYGVKVGLLIIFWLIIFGHIWNQSLNVIYGEIMLELDRSVLSTF